MRILRAAVAAQAALHVPSDKDCCVFARAVLERTYGRETIQRVELSRWHLWAGTPGVGPWEPVLAAIDAGIGSARDAVAEGPAVGRWHLCQGWRGTPMAPGVSGHTWLWFAITAEVGLVLDSARNRGPDVDGLTKWVDYTAQFRGGVALAVLARPGSVEARGRCGDRGCELAAGHDGLHFAANKIDPW